MEITTSSLITYSFLLVIAGVFVWFSVEAFKFLKAGKRIKEAIEESDILNSLSITVSAVYTSKYQETFVNKIGNKQKTNIPAEAIFSEHNVQKAFKINARMLDAASGTLVGLGLLGTFAGLTFGINGFQSGDAEQIKSSIDTLLAGMGTAFLTSLCGMFGSLVYTLLDKCLRNYFVRNLRLLQDELDAKYYIDDMAFMTYFLNDRLTFTTSEGQSMTLGNAMRELLVESAEQSKALKSFSTDLALELNSGFDEVLSRQMQQKIIPLMESVNATTRAVVDHIDTMADKVSNPAADMMESVVGDLKQSMGDMMKEFSQGLSGSATQELENLALQLGTATKAMSEFPDQITLAIGQLSKATDDMGSFMKSMVTSLSSSVQSSVGSLAEGVTNQQTALLELQEDTTAQTKNLLESFNSGLARLNEINDYISGTLEGFTKAQGEITLSTTNLRTVSGDVKLATELFNKGQHDYASRLSQLQESSQKSIDQIANILLDSGQLSEEYAQKFELIRQGLGSIFAQLQSGLTEYSRTVKDTTDKYLNQYTTSLTQTTDALSSTIERQNEITEMLTDTISHLKK